MPGIDLKFKWVNHYRPRETFKSDKDLRWSIMKGFLKVWNNCIEAFVRELDSIIRVYTGMTKATLLPLAATIELEDINLSGARAPIKGGLQMPDGWFDPSLIKSIPTGESLGNRAYFKDLQGTTLTFQWNIMTYQYKLHEHRSDLPGTGPWRTLILGPTKFRQTWEAKAFDYLPALRDVVYIEGK